jgi:hypothetical protein
MLEQWNDGIMGANDEKRFLFSLDPFFHYSILPVTPFQGGGMI